jgi:hypothetical protein
MAPEVTRIESVEFSYRLDDLGTDRHGFNLVNTPGESVERELLALTIETDECITDATKHARVPGGHGHDAEFHAPGPAQRHCIATTRKTNCYEMAPVHPDAPNTTPPTGRRGLRGFAGYGQRRGPRRSTREPRTRRPLQPGRNWGARHGVRSRQRTIETTSTNDREDTRSSGESAERPRER